MAFLDKKKSSMDVVLPGGDLPRMGEPTRLLAPDMEDLLTLVVRFSKNCSEVTAISLFSIIAEVSRELLSLLSSDTKELSLCWFVMKGLVECTELDLLLLLMKGVEEWTEADLFPFILSVALGLSLTKLDSTNSAVSYSDSFNLNSG